MYKFVLYQNMATFEDLASEYYAEIDAEIIELIEEERKWEVISNFKEFISKEPEFLGIHNLSSQTILNIIETSTSNENKKEYPKWHVSFLAKLINDVTNFTPDINLVKNVYDNIYDKMYV